MASLRDEKGRVSWEKVQNRLVSVLTVKTEHCVAEETDDPYYPLSWWDKQGFPAEQVEANGKKRPCPVFGTVYSAPAFPLQAEQSQQTYGEVPFGPHGKAEAAEATAEVQEKGPGHGADTSFPSCEYENPPGLAHLP